MIITAMLIYADKVKARDVSVLEYLTAIILDLSMAALL